MNRFAFAAVGLLFPIALAASPANAQAARHYDCTKAGNANKAACKGAATVTKPVVATKTVTTTATKPRNYDCTKPGNANKAVCKSAPVAVAPAPRPATATVTRTATTHSTATTHVSGDKPTHAGGPNGATAQCKDGTYSKSTHHSGTCSGHKGVATWY